MESGLRALPGFKCLRAAVNYFCAKVSEIFTGSDVVALYSQALLKRQVEMICGQQPRISHF